MPDYKNGKIYCIRVNDSDKIYIGSTVNSLCRRMTGHRDTFKKWKDGNWSYCSSYELFLIGTPYIELIEIYPCNSKEELHKREGEIIRNTVNCVNKSIPSRTYKEWYEANKSILSEKAKLYREAHKEEISLMNKEYRENNKDKIKEYQIDYTATHKEEKNAYDLKRRTEQRDYVNQKQRENYAKRKALKNIPS